jgi:flagellar motor switch protein FliN/FliY
VDDLSPEEIDSLSQAMGEEATALKEKPEQEAGEGAATKDGELQSLDKPPASVSPAHPASSNEPGESAESPSISRAQFMQLEELAIASNLPPLELQRMADIKVKVEVLLGSTKLSLEKILEFNPGRVVELDRLAGEPVDVYANDKHIARAEVVIVNDNFGIKILEITGTEQKLKVVEK